MPDTATFTPPRARSYGRALPFALVSLVALIISAPLYTWATLSWSYSEGDRAGILQKVSRKGWLCKTYEGELAMYVVGGIAPQIWNFSVRDSAIADQLRAAVGQRVQLHYTEHLGIPTSCFGDTPYFVDAVTVVNGAGNWRR